ncbi:MULTISPECIES: DUF6263 family protein [Roseivirga]|uniref:Lipocalin-like domain-containing protein n=1 Tax=Roseivirga thermotolerans TaxID=1758176 RepID=A0ABQ3I9E7_9BACT|nr:MULTISPECIES: DUF6263 family protein [Roseivirga]MEC7752662.1 DUF6263 family protein [Bacteroidota bacterium]GHE66506.1 hypothetical protein GCM10011340_22290 [Roseivirga thermotolerans]|tara:strand:- start:4636 stop:5493 length:858 start_codon:yes stop_codon:yes gene_type:complete
MKTILTWALLACIFTQLPAQNISKYTLKKGDKFSIEMSLNQDITQQVMGQSTEMEQVQQTKDFFEVLAVENGEYRIKTTALKRSFAINADMMQMEMSSENEGEQNLPFRLMVDKSYEFTMTAQGKVTAVYGLEELVNGLKSDLQGTIYGSEVGQIISVYDKETILSSLNQQFNIYPEGNSQTWQKTNKLVVNNAPIETATTYSYENANTILANAKVNLDGNIEQMGMVMKTKLSGTQENKYVISTSNGLPETVTIKQSVTGDVEAQGMVIPMTVVTNSTFKVTMQ